MKRKSFVAWVAFVAALGMGYGCSDNALPPPGPTSIDLNGKTYTEKYTCNEQFGGVPPITCPDLNDQDVIMFTSTAPGIYTGADVPDTGFVYNGTLSGTTFTWNAVSPFGYTETGIWTFSADGSTFSGSSQYVADPPGNYSGDCNTTGVLGTASSPPNPPLPTGCP